MRVYTVVVNWPSETLIGTLLAMIVPIAVPGGGAIPVPGGSRIAVPGTADIMAGNVCVCGCLGWGVVVCVWCCCVCLCVSVHMVSVLCASVVRVGPGVRVYTTVRRGGGRVWSPHVHVYARSRDRRLKDTMSSSRTGVEGVPRLRPRLSALAAAARSGP